MSIMQLPKVLDKKNLATALNHYRQQQQKIVFTNGCFDLLHVGHIRYLEQAAALGDVLIVAVNSDASVKKLKGPTRPIQNENDRAEILASLKPVTHTIIFDEDTPYNIISEILPQVLVKGGDWPIDQIVGSDVVLAHGGEVKSLLFIDGKSTTHIIEKSKT